MKCFERLVKDHITSTLPVILDTLEFAFRPNRSTDNAIAIAMHTALSHLDKRNTYVRKPFIDYSSALNTIVPSKLFIKLEALGLNPPNWVLDFLTGHPQVVKIGKNTSTSLIPTRKGAHPPPVLPVHPWLRGHARLNHPWECGARKITSRPTSTKQRRLLWTSENSRGSTPLSTSMGRSGEGGTFQVPRHTHH